MKISTTLTFVLALAMMCAFCQSANAQDLNLFSGRGLGAKYDLKPEAKEESRWPKLKDFSLGEPPKLFQFGGTPKSEGSFPKLFSGDMPKFNLFKGGSTENPFAGISSLFPKRDPSQPNFFEKLNSKSKGLVDKTTDWAQRQNAGLKSRTFDTWNSIIKGLSPGARRTDSSLMAPPTRSAEAPNMKPGVRRF